MRGMDTLQSRSAISYSKATGYLQNKRFRLLCDVWPVPRDACFDGAIAQGAPVLVLVLYVPDYQSTSGTG